MGIAKSIGRLIGAVSRQVIAESLDNAVGRADATFNATAFEHLDMKTPDQREADLESGNVAKREALRGVGVDVDSLSEDTILSDALSITNTLCGLKVRANKKPTKVKPCWMNLTKTGKVPKKVSEGLALFDWGNGDSVIVHVWYLASLEPYAADVYSWHGDKCHEYFVRTKGGEMVVDHEGVSDISTGYREFVK